MIDQKFEVVFQISQTPNVPQKWFNAQDGPLDVRSQIRSLHGLDLSHVRPDIQRSVLSTETFLKDIWGLQYLENNIELLVNH